MDITANNQLSSKDTSLVIRASQILALIIAFGLAGMIASILISESINNNAEKINHSNSLRSLATKVTLSQLSGNPAKLEHAITRFQQHLDSFRIGAKNNSVPPPAPESFIYSIKNYWPKIKKGTATTKESENFAEKIDRLTQHFQQQTKDNIQLLRLIQYGGFFIIILISYITIYSLQNSIIHPLKLLVDVATDVGQRNFTSRADESANGELGLLAKTLNDMSAQLSLTYQDLENRVTQKTAELEQKNRSLSILYRSAHNLSSTEHNKNLGSLLNELESTLGKGKVTLHLMSANKPLVAPKPDTHVSSLPYYVVGKDGHNFGSLIWKIPANSVPEPWQKELLIAMTNLIATSVDLDNKRRTESLLEIMEERAVIARELHDSLAQSLSYLKLQISILNKQFQKKRPYEETSLTINDISHGTNQAYKQLREILTTFRLKIDNESFENALQDTIREFSTKCNHPITLTFDIGKSSLNPHQEIHLLQIIREALSNIHKHSNATAANIRILSENNNIILTVQDNGCGLPRQPSKDGHFGLNIMKERAKSLEGDLHITKNAPSGTAIELTFSLNTEDTT